MRKIKFRAWHKKFKGYYEVVSMDFNKKTIYIEAKHDYRYVGFDEVILEQFTGIKDSYGNEIYENDILFDEHYEEFGKVTFEEGSYMVHWSTYYHELIHIRNEIVIIRGNIHENKERIE